MTTLIPVSSSWTVDGCGVRPLGVQSKRLGDLSPRRQKIRERIAEHGLTSPYDIRRGLGRAR